MNSRLAFVYSGGVNRAGPPDAAVPGSAALDASIEGPSEELEALPDTGEEDDYQVYISAILAREEETDTGVIRTTEERKELDATTTTGDSLQST